MCQLIVIKIKLIVLKILITEQFCSQCFASFDSWSLDSIDKPDSVEYDDDVYIFEKFFQNFKLIVVKITIYDQMKSICLIWFWYFVFKKF